MKTKGVSFFIKSNGIVGMAALLIFFFMPFVHAQTTDMAFLDASIAASNDAAAEETKTEEPKPRFDIYGFAMLDTFRKCWN